MLLSSLALRVNLKWCEFGEMYTFHLKAFYMDIRDTWYLTIFISIKKQKQKQTTLPGLVFTPVCACVHAQLHSCVRPFATLWTVAHQIPVSMGFPRQEYWTGLPFPSPSDLPNPGMELTSPESPALAHTFFTTMLPGKPLTKIFLKRSSRQK